jgi:hypothetical protein
MMTRSTVAFAILLACFTPVVITGAPAQKPKTPPSAPPIAPPSETDSSSATAQPRDGVIHDFHAISGPDEKTKITSGSFKSKPSTEPKELCYTFRMGNGIWIPETEWVNDTCCIGPVCSSCPKCQVRDCTTAAFVQICGPDHADITGQVTECARIGAAAALAAALAGTTSASETLFLGAFKLCLAGQGIDWGSKVTVRVYTQKECGGWRNCSLLDVTEECRGVSHTGGGKN